MTELELSQNLSYLILDTKPSLDGLPITLWAEFFAGTRCAMVDVILINLSTGADYSNSLY